MHMLLSRSALHRGKQLVAGMLAVFSQDAVVDQHDERDTKLVSWSSTARSRREDELARWQMSQHQS